MIRLNKLKINKMMLIYFIIFVNILSSSSVYMVYLNAINSSLVSFCQFFVFAINMICFFVSFRSLKINAFNLVIPLIVGFVILFASIFGSGDLGSTVIFSMKIISVWYLCMALGKLDVDLFKILYKIIFFMICYVFAWYVMVDLLGIDFPCTYFYSIDNMGRASNDKYENYFNVYFCRLTNSGGTFGFKNIKRMSGFSWEVGQYMIYLNYVLWYLLFIGLKLDSPYINSGVLLIDVKKWNNFDAVKKFTEYIGQNLNNLQYMDQDAINAVFENHIRVIHPKYNATIHMFNYSRDELCKYHNSDMYYDDKTLCEAVNDPTIVHFNRDVSSVRPWYKNGEHKFREEWLEIRKQTAWANEELWDDNRNKIEKMKCCVFNILPRKVGICIARYLNKKHTKNIQENWKRVYLIDKYKNCKV